VVRAFVALGIKKVRITGGEPLTRPDLLTIIEAISVIPGITDLSMTTNGIILDQMAVDLKQAGLQRLNISLDSLREERFREITGGSLYRVLKGIDKSLEVGLQPVKINTVLMKGVNDDEVDDFIALTRDWAVDLRFIELMPIGDFGVNHAAIIVRHDELLRDHPGLIPCDNGDENLPARYYRREGYQGRVGLISPVSHKFCSRCNRMRLTCDGKIRPCLGDNGEVDLTGVLRSKPEILPEFIRKVIYEKPRGHCFGGEFVSSRSMDRIGG
jgi:cyclic pyranopterin phosphate synthase